MKSGVTGGNVRLNFITQMCAEMVYRFSQMLDYRLKLIQAIHWHVPWERTYISLSPRTSTKAITMATNAPGLDLNLGLEMACESLV